MSGSPFFKLSGAGNDFVALVGPAAEPHEAQVRAWCRRGLSLGADGVFTLERRRGGARMRHYNADGSRADLCLNGSRCAARLALHLGWGDGKVELVTDAGVLRARRTGDDRVAVELPDIVGRPEARSLEWSGQRHDGFYLRVGVPHFVLPWPESLRDAPVAELGAPLRRHPDLGADGANVNFVRYVAPGHCELRTFERGVEAETLACGTGVVATVAAGTAAGRLELPASALTSGGYELSVRGGGEGPLVLEGDARILASGDLLAGADAVPAPPLWS
ncbi:MAG: diaminopimelate epimerase [bacterium]|nr:diaminopimelate epimerase [bacterium]